MDKCDSEAAHRCLDSHKPDGLANANKNLKVPRTKGTRDFFLRSYVTKSLLQSCKPGILSQTPCRTLPA